MTREMTVLLTSLLGLLCLFAPGCGDTDSSQSAGPGEDSVVSADQDASDPVSAARDAGPDDRDEDAAVSASDLTPPFPEPPLELSTELCDDPSKIEALIEALQSDQEGEAGSPSYGEVNVKQVERMVMAPTEGPFYMVNLIRYREMARYPDGRESDLTGREANALYAPVDFLAAVGATIVYAGEATAASLAADDTWDDVAIVEYPCPLAFLAMASHPDFQARAVHKEAGVEQTIVMVTHLVPLAGEEVAQPPSPATAEDLSFDRVRVHSYHEEARYPEGSEESAQSGEEAAANYAAAIGPIERAQGIHAKARLEVQGVFIGDERTFDAVWIDGVPSQAALDAVTDDPAFAPATVHLDAALKDAYEILVTPQLSDLPGADNDAGQTPPPITADGTGTLCQSDDECPDEGPSTCFKPSGDQGFCSNQGCGAGECEAPYLCCHDCSPMAAPMLPFEGSVCLPEDGTSQLTAAPVSCTCD